MAPVTHRRCGGSVAFDRRILPGEEYASTVIVCDKCEAVIDSTADLSPAGAICGLGRSTCPTCHGDGVVSVSYQNDPGRCADVPCTCVTAAI